MSVPSLDIGDYLAVRSDNRVCGLAGSCWYGVSMVTQASCLISIDWESL
jgi:hypothetical protein